MRLPSLVILDLGGVVFDADFDRVFSSWGAKLALAKEAIRERFRFDEQFGRFERGQISPQDYHLHIRTDLGIELSYEDFVSGWNAIYGDVFPEAQACLPLIRKRAKLVAFTNTNELHCQIWPEKYEDALANFDEIYASSKIGLRKPEADGFQYVLNACGTRIEDALFLDDFAPNVEAAKDFGLGAARVEDPRRIRELFTSLGVLDK